ncbi:MAG: hypothetical protein IJL87_02855, partial [Clostridia bacterium]|nr:hypothetical protein [Clostridia bacterium]
MKKYLSFIRFAATVLTSLSIFFGSLFSPGTIKPSFGESSLSVLRLPCEAVKTLEQNGLAESEYLARGDYSQPEYVVNAGHTDVNGVIISPYYSAKIGGEDVPVYATTVVAWEGEISKAELHSFSEVYVEPDSDFCFTFEVNGSGAEIKNAIVLPEKLGVKTVCINNTMRVSISQTGIYTFLFNGANPEHGYTLAVREKLDDDERIKKYIDLYGEENVTVFEPGMHERDYIRAVDSSGRVIYLKQGAYVIANHLCDSSRAENTFNAYEDGAGDSLSVPKYNFLDFFRSKNIIIEGHGIFDFTRLDKDERGSFNMTECENITVSGVKLVNAPRWTLYTYACKNLKIDNVDIFGYRGNSDAFAICNTTDALIENCFARSADDLFEVKTLGGNTGSENITFKSCVAWGGYARCFGVTGEVYRPIKNILFTDCSVVWRSGTWDNDRLGSLVVVAELTEGSIDGVRFENIEIFRDEGRAILVK